MTIDVFGSLHGLERVLDRQLARHGVLASNLANAETPGFRALDLEIDEGIAGAMELAASHRRHLQPDGGVPEGTRVVEVPASRIDGGGVELERVMAQLSANRIRYESAIEITRRRLAVLRYAALDGGG